MRSPIAIWWSSAGLALCWLLALPTVSYISKPIERLELLEAIAAATGHVR